MIGRPQPRRRSARPSPAMSPTRRILLLPLLALLILGLLGAGLLTGCGAQNATPTSAATSGASTTPSSATGTGGHPAGDETSTSATAPSGEGTFPVTVTDDNGNSVTIEAQPKRIVSTAPANTWTLFALGLGDRVVGVTSLPGEPPQAADITKIGDYQPNVEAIMGLSPDLVLGYAGNEETLAPVQSEGAPVLIFDPTSLEQIYANITTIGAATGAPGKAAEVVASIQAQIKAVTDVTTTLSFSPKVFYALDNTLWTAGPGSFVDELLTLVGATNVGSMGKSAAGGQPYFQFTPEQLVAADPDIVLLPASVYKSADEFASDPRFAHLTAVKDKAVFLIDDVVVTQPGPQIGTGVETLAKAVHLGAF